MQFKIIPLEMLCTNLNDFLMNHYNRGFEQLKKQVFIDITLERFNALKKGKPLEISEIREIVGDFKIGNVKEKIEILKKVWLLKEKEIFRVVEGRTNINLSSDNLICYLDPYTYLGFYGKGESVTIGAELPVKDSLMVITHELFHMFYWKKVVELGLSEKNNLKKFEWNLSEVTVYLLLKENQFKRFWPGVNINLYPDIKKVYEQVRNLWMDEKFEGYLKKSYNLLNKNE